MMFVLSGLSLVVAVICLFYMICFLIIRFSWMTVTGKYVQYTEPKTFDSEEEIDELLSSEEITAEYFYFGSTYDYEYDGKVCRCYKEGRKKKRMKEGKQEKLLVNPQNLADCFSLKRESCLYFLECVGFVLSVSFMITHWI